MRFIFVLLSLFAMSSARASVNLIDNQDGWKVDMSGFIETDIINDSTRSFTEVIGNAPVKPTNGLGGQTQMSIRNSRLAFNVQAPTWEDFKSRGYFEFDLLGYDPSPGTTNTESAFFNNPTMRVRHAFVSTEKDGWQALAGQTWALLGWQPYYFVPTIQVAPIPGMLYSRTVQLRGMKTLDLTSDSTLQLAAGIMRPPERASELPALELGARWALNDWSGAFTGGATGSHTPQPLSVGLSGTVRDLETYSNAADPTSSSSQTGYGVALDFLVPVLRSPDGKSTSNNLVIGGEYTIGQGYGDEFSSWTGSEYGPLNTSALKPDSMNPIDAGIVGYEPADNGYDLVKLQTLNIYAQYHLPERLRTWVAAGYSQLYSSNIAAMATNGEAYDKEESLFANISHDCTDRIRVGLEYMQVKTTYAGSMVYGSLTSSPYANTAPIDNRFQLSTWFIF